MASSCGWRRLNLMVALAVIIAPAVADAEMHRLVIEYKECSILMFRRASTTTDRPCPARHYCHGGQARCFPCSTCNGSDCRRMTYEPQCTNSFPFSYQMSASKPHYTPACSVASLLGTSELGSDNKETARVKIESCEPGCDNLGTNGSERCFSGTSCQLTCSNASVITKSWTALCNCSYLGNVATCDWIQMKAVCKTADIQLPTATAKRSQSERSPKGSARLESILGITYASYHAGDTSSPGQFAGRSRGATVGQLNSLTKRTEPTKGRSDIQEGLAVLIPLLILMILMIFIAVVVIVTCRGYRNILNISNVKNDNIYNYNIASGIGVTALGQDETNDVSESPSDILDDHAVIERHMTDVEPSSTRSPLISELRVRELLGNGATVAADGSPN